MWTDGNAEVEIGTGELLEDRRGFAIEFGEAGREFDGLGALYADVVSDIGGASVAVEAHPRLERRRGRHHIRIRRLVPRLLLPSRQSHRLNETVELAFRSPFARYSFYVTMQIALTTMHDYAHVV